VFYDGLGQISPHRKYQSLRSKLRKYEEKYNKEDCIIGFGGEGTCVCVIFVVMP
jgi:hypothetical protein